jgi:hypothetical protein
MSPPAPVIAALVVLIGYPLIQLISVLIVRPSRRRMKELATQLLSDPQYNEKQLKHVRDNLASARGDLLFILFPIGAPILIASASWAELRGELDKYRDEEAVLASAHREMEELDRLLERVGEPPLPYKLPIWNDPRFVELRDLSQNVAMLRSPIALCLAALTSLAAAPLWLLAYGTRVSVTRLWSAWTKLWSTTARRFALNMRMAHQRF